MEPLILPPYYETITLLIDAMRTAGDSVGFTHEGVFIDDPRMSVCSRFRVDPVEEYGLDKINKWIDDARALATR